MWNKILIGSKWKFLLSKKYSHGLSTVMQKVPTVLYVKEQDCNWSMYVGYLNPITYWKMTKSSNLASIAKTLLDVSKTQTTQRWSRNGKEKGKEFGGLQRYVRFEGPFPKYINFRSHHFALAFVYLTWKQEVLEELDSLLLQLWKKSKFSMRDKSVLEEI